MRRLFLAIPIKTEDNGFRPLLDGLRRRLSHEKEINWANPEQTHLTLKFIGHTGEDDLQRIIEAVGETLASHKSFDINFNKVGIFGSHYAPRVIWLGMNEQSQQLVDLEEDILNTFDKIGFLRDRQNFVPHLTLGRIRSLCEKAYFQKVIQNVESKTYIAQPVNKITLYQSFLNPNGAHHKALKSWSL